MGNRGRRQVRQALRAPQDSLTSSDEAGTAGAEARAAAEIDRTERRMAAVEGASQLVQTSYMMDRLYDDLLDLYKAHGTAFDGELSARIDGKRTAVRLQAENLELHIQLLLSDVVGAAGPGTPERG